MDDFSEEEKEAIKAVRKLIRESKAEAVIKNMSQVTDDILIRYIRGRNFDIQSATERLLKLANTIRNHPEIFSTLHPSALSIPFSKKGYNVLKNRDSKGRHIYCIRAGTFNPDITTLDDMVRVDMIMAWEMTHFKETQLNGNIMLCDCTGFTLKTAMSFSPMKMKKFADAILKTSAVKIKGTHLIHTPAFFSKTLSIIKFFLPKKLRQRIYVHGNSMESLHKWLSPDILPEWAGGNLSEDEAYDKTIFDELFTPEKDEWYKTHCIVNK